MTLSEMFAPRKRQAPKEITAQIPLGVRSDGTILMLPVESVDEPVILIGGARGQGKTTLVQRLVDYAKNILYYNAIIVNDIKGETYAWRVQQKDNELIRIMKRSGLQEPLISLPIRTFAPSFSIIETTKLAQHVFSPKIEEIKCSEAWSCVLSFEGNITMKFLFDSICMQLADAKSLEDVRETVMGDPEIPSQVKKAIMVRIKTLMIHPKPYPLINNPEVVMPNGKGVPSMNSLIKSIEDGYLPSIVTYYATGFGDEYLRFAVAEIIDVIMSKQFNAIHFPEKHKNFGKPFWMFVLEMTRIASTTARDHGAAMKINQWVCQGRGASCGFVGEAQDYCKIPTIVRNECNYLFAFQTRGANNVNAMMNDMGLDISVARNMTRLAQHEFVAIPKDKPLTVMLRDGKIVKTMKPQYALALPSLSYHLRAGEQINGGEQ